MLELLYHEIQLLPYVNKVGFNSMDDEEFTIPYITDKTPNLPAGHRVSTYTKHNVWIVYINV